MSKTEKTYSSTDNFIFAMTGLTFIVFALSSAAAAAMYWWGGPWTIPMGLGAGTGVLFACFFAVSIVIA